MSLKISQASQVSGAAAAARSAAIHHAAPPAGLRTVNGMAASNRSGAEDESLRFTDTWDELQQQQQRRRARLGLHPDSVRFGDVLASEDIGAMMLGFRAQDMRLMPPLRLGAMLYERSNVAIGTGGRMRVLGGHVNRVL